MTAKGLVAASPRLGILRHDLNEDMVILHRHLTDPKALLLFAL
jgi:hypothetical protein